MVQFRCFGAKAYIRISEKNRNKLDQVTEEGRLVRYSEISKAYRILLRNNRIAISRNVVFDESKFFSEVAGCDDNKSES